MHPYSYLNRVLIALVVAVTLVAPTITTPAQAQAPRELPAAIEVLAGELRSTPIVLDESDVAPPVERADPNAPVNALRAAQDTLQDLVASADPRSERALRAALAELEGAWEAFAGGSPDLSHLGDTTKALHRAQVHLKVAVRSSDPGAKSDIKALQIQLTGIAAQMAGAMLHRAESAGVAQGLLLPAVQRLQLGERFAALGRYDVAVVHLGGALSLAANTVTFDVALYEQNIKDALAGKTVGHAFSTAYQGQLYQGGESFGLARTAADAPQTNQSPAKELHVASVSKTLTAIVTLRLLQENGLTPDAKVAPFLPGGWSLGDGVDDLTFRDFMKHESGFAQIDAGNTYQDLQEAIATDVGDTSFSYKNANYGLMRVLAAGLQGIDVSVYWWISPDALTTAAFLWYAQGLFDSIGVGVDCRPTDANPTIQYNFPHNGASGYLEPDRRMTCGGYGWHASSNDLAAVLANLRLTENLLSTQTRDAMEDAFLGFMDPAEYGWVGGDFGVYYLHGGDWLHGAGEAHACAVSFPIQVQTGLVINSERGAGMPYQCRVLQTAFDDAWVAD